MGSKHLHVLAVLIVAYAAALISAQAPDPSLCAIDPNARTDCRIGNQAQCEAAGCCWNPTYNGGPAWCFYPTGSTPPTSAPPTDCSTFNGINSGIVVCSGQETLVNPSKVSNRYWQAPVRGDKDYRDTYGDAQYLVGYPQVTYDSSHTTARVNVIVFTRSNTTANLRYIYNGVSSTSSVFYASSNLTTSLNIQVTDNDKSLVLEPVDFIWNNPPVNQPPNYINGQKGAIIEMFGWPHDDVAQECEMLGKAGYMGVKIFPPQEHVMSDLWLQNGERNPWYFQYQPVSYKLSSRMGTRAQLRNMILTCRKYGVRVYADAVINHMSGGGNDRLQHRNSAGGGCTTWGDKDSSAGSFYATHPFTYLRNSYTGEPPALEYPSVPYFAEHFHCERSLSSWADPFSLDNGWLVGLSDLNTDLDYVQQRIADYITELIGIGFSGIRVDAAKHMSPKALGGIFGRLKRNLGGRFTDDFIAALEVLIGGEASLLCCNANSGYNYYTGLNNELAANGLSNDDINKIKIFASDYPKEFPICGSWVLSPSRFTIQQDDHDQQNPGSSSRDMADKGSVYIKDKDINRHRNFNIELFSRPAPVNGNDWMIKYVLSSYSFMSNGAAGFPDGYSSCSGAPPEAGRCISMEYAKAFDPNSCGYDTGNGGNWKEGAYTRVHRDRSVIMAMRKWMGLSTSVSNEQIGLPSNCV